MGDGAKKSDLKSILNSTHVGELLLQAGVELRPDQSVAEAAAEMRTQSHGSAVICEGQTLVGIFTERDLLGFLARGGDLQTPLADVMTERPHTVSQDDFLIDAIRLMDSGGYRRVPVVDENGASSGIVDVKTVVHLLVEHFPAAVYNKASQDQIIARSREGA